MDCLKANQNGQNLWTEDIGKCIWPKFMVWWLLGLDRKTLESHVFRRADQWNFNDCPIIPTSVDDRINKVIFNLKRAKVIKKVKNFLINFNKKDRIGTLKQLQKLYVPLTNHYRHREVSEKQNSIILHGQIPQKDWFCQRHNTKINPTVIRIWDHNALHWQVE